MQQEVKVNPMHHAGMVTDLSKPGIAILETLTPTKCALLHIAVGVIGEIAEINTAIMNAVNFESIDHENMVEELGDTEFYLEGFRQELQIDRDETITYDSQTVFALHGQYYGTAQSDIIKLTSAAGNLLDLTKKYAIYNKDLDRAKTLEVLQRVEIYMETIRSHFGIPRKTTVVHNLNKLLKGDNARYASGSYSDEQAQERADKSS